MWPGALSGRSFLLAVQTGVARKSLDHELRADEAGKRAVQAERGNRHQNQAREPVSQIIEGEAPSVQVGVGPFRHQNIGSTAAEIDERLPVRASARRSDIARLLAATELPEQRLRAVPDRSWHAGPSRWRSGEPPSGSRTTTSAPQSANWRPQYAAATPPASSRTRTPAKRLLPLQSVRPERRLRPAISSYDQVSEPVLWPNRSVSTPIACSSVT